MKFKILHEIRGRMRVHIVCKRISMKDADILQYYLTAQTGVTSVKVNERNQDVAVWYCGKREELIRALQKFSFENAQAPDHIWQNSGRGTNRAYWDKIAGKVVARIGNKLFFPRPLRHVIIVCKAAKYIWRGLYTLGKRKIEVSVLDGTAIAVSLLRRDMETAGSVMFLLDIGEILEEWTHKKSVDDLTRSMSINIGKVWLRTDEGEILTDTDHIRPGDQVVIRMGSMIPFDGIVAEGSGAVNQASMTGEALPVSREAGGYVYAGTVLEEGELVVRVKETSGSNKYEKIVRMIEESARLKSSMEGEAAHLADRLVSYDYL